MPGHLTAWPRPYFERPGGRPSLFYVVFGAFEAGYEIGSEHRTLGVQPGLRRRLVERAAEVARRSGVEWLHVDYEPALEGFYARCGFRPTPAGLMRLGNEGEG
jgi:hypothetical protein